MNIDLQARRRMRRRLKVAHISLIIAVAIAAVANIAIFSYLLHVR